jgi:hypothetical protein
MKPVELIICVDVLCHKKWGRTLVDGQLRSRSWWERRRDALINSPAIQISVELLKDGEPPEKSPIPYEKEMELK